MTSNFQYKHGWLVGILAVLLASCASTGGPSRPTLAPAASWRADVVALADAEDNAGRRQHLQSRLQAMGFTVQVQPFTARGLTGENLLVDAGGASDAPLLLLGAHSDRVSQGRGATDNASGSAVMLALAGRFKREPLQHHRVQVAFWDLEEQGLLGASAYASERANRPALYVNVDVFGWGNSLWMMTPDPAHPLVAATQLAASAQGLALSAGAQYPPSDHRAFLHKGLPAVSYSLVGSDEIAGILEAFSGKGPATPPKVMSVIHTENDTVEQLDAEAAARGVDAIEAALRRWDAESATSPSSVGVSR